MSLVNLFHAIPEIQVNPGQIRDLGQLVKNRKVSGYQGSVPLFHLCLNLDKDFSLFSSKSWF
jgi:hypothetical protein